MTRFLVTGASGLLGLNFGMQMAAQHDVVGVVNQNALTGTPFQVLQQDLSQPGVVRAVLESTRPDVVIHCAAMANIDACENNPELAMQVNADVPGEFAKITRQMDIKLVHISTDAVFDGLVGNYIESDTPNPLSVYAKSKLAGEEIVAATNPDAIIARVNFYGWSLKGKRSLSEFFFNHLSSGKPMMGFTDVCFCPLMVNDLVEILVEMVAADLKGIYHTLSSESLTKYQFGCAIAKRFGYDEHLVEPVSVFDSGLLAARSPNLTLSTQKLAQALGHILPDQQRGLERLFALYQQGYVEKIHAFDPAAG
ncbi:MAG: hypothetical protein CVU39_04200 [Chloroflexi bacterium HGW-Chloroflexi-10]|nr:MAG: hypothetical protein CVU39_04200 [Chloroflexi bacterium HGW-Chloroflexi-10]